MLAKFRTIGRPVCTPPNNLFAAVNIPSDSFIAAAAFTANQPPGQCILAVVSSFSLFSYVGRVLALALGNFCLHFAEYLFSYDSLVMILYVVLRKLTSIFLLGACQYALSKCLLQQHVTAIFFVLKDSQNCL